MAWIKVNLGKITKYTRAGKKGKFICCPACEHTFKIFHFAWYSVRCEKCKTVTQKYDFKIAEV